MIRILMAGAVAVGLTSIQARAGNAFSDRLSVAEPSQDFTSAQSAQFNEPDQQASFGSAQLENFGRCNQANGLGLEMPGSLAIEFGNDCE